MSGTGGRWRAPWLTPPKENPMPGQTYAELLAERDRLRDMVAALEAETADHDLVKDTSDNLRLLEQVRRRTDQLAQERREKDTALENLRVSHGNFERAHRAWMDSLEQVRNLTGRLEEVTAERDAANRPNLGLATTRQILAELAARIDVDHSSGGGGLDYSTVRGRPGTPS